MRLGFLAQGEDSGFEGGLKLIEWHAGNHLDSVSMSERLLMGKRNTYPTSINQHLQQSQKRFNVTLNFPSFKRKIVVYANYLHSRIRL